MGGRTRFCQESVNGTRLLYFFVESGDDEVRSPLDALLNLLAFEYTVLFQESPSQPQERHQRHDRDATISAISFRGGRGDLLEGIGTGTSLPLSCAVWVAGLCRFGEAAVSGNRRPGLDFCRESPRREPPCSVVGVGRLAVYST